MKMSWSQEGNLQVIMFREKEQQLKCVGEKITHTPSTIRAIPSGLLNRLAKLTSRTPSLHYEGVDEL